MTVDEVASVQNSNVSPKLDVWSCGCLLFLLFTGRHPFGYDAGGPLLPSPCERPGLPDISEPEMSAGPTEPDWHHLGEIASGALPLCRLMLERNPWSRAGAGECLEHPWLTSAAAGQLEENTVPLESLKSLVQLHARSKVGQVVTNLVVSELGPSPFDTISDCLAILTGSAPADVDQEIPEILASMPAHVSSALMQLKISETSLKKVVRAFGSEAGCSSVYTKFFEGCAKLAEDRFDHALWRIFTAAGQDHRGIISMGDLEWQLKELPGTGDILSRMHAFLQKPPATLAGEAAARQAMCVNDEVTFEALKDHLTGRLPQSIDEFTPTSYIVVNGNDAFKWPGSGETWEVVGHTPVEEVLIRTLMPEAG
jgi:hypothetical protein